MRKSWVAWLLALALLVPASGAFAAFGDGLNAVQPTATPANTATPQPTATAAAGVATATAFPTCAAGVIAEGTGSQGLQCGVVALTTATPAAGVFPYDSAGGAGSVLAFATLVPTATAIPPVATATPIPPVATATPAATATPQPGASTAPITNTLSGDVSLSNTSNYFDGPSAAQGSTGTWCAFGTVTFDDSNASGSAFALKLWDGTTVIASTYVNQPAISSEIMTASLSGCLASPAGNIRISVKDIGFTTGKILFNQSGNSKDSTITVHRIQ